MNEYAVLPWIIVPLAYLIGSLPFAVIVSKIMGLQDPRQYGSGNPGATNVLRTGNKTAAALTLLGDAAKGWLPVWALRTWGPEYDMGTSVLALTAIAVFLGHLFPLFLGFKGGKGVATALGVLLGLAPWLALLVALTWLASALIWRYSSLAALIAAAAAPLFYILGSGIAWRSSMAVGTAIVVMSLLLFTRHRANIERLLAGKESRIGQKKSQHGGNASLSGKMHPNTDARKQRKR
ncbi:glycerol-3-phosphate 1-O-acyltransferase PlsY [Kerstersia gyiorum]|jgi:glycerol-3-phosphate acyltransferase PlsY|uniref:Glycerol-3-phosphate acyltransferase n=1 Tax=Kerstersia gyiorum TaxID=206506 RepID=A0A4Q7MIF6_9BURK|nr:glycerol-3-phosphate 1-O-acyltransferase PlsY [Kerstersia gyiorum]AZV93838.1 glycerol-3-phosphate acyltransferase [Bordetella sp. J329]MCO7639569.1 glycerol-3-phosphate 1-O-acyltransferase PlsY [Pseudomonas sp. S 311-6]KAB0543049.1 glycerol-3-phosphate 1-O-acyltransferase PlsY [Kerstersia gyiorum]MCH4272410.1 glycerol-3-phosphate 1-O-acyltransferase PlsY [Kerstersia gyiorum]MCI1229467.1 glycerol-3-phosphate 1-O-acyltransferase PlsY [Kerstersia gyiorum]